jgi:hypothetical protein
MLLAKTIISSKITLGPALQNNVKWSSPEWSQRTLDNQLKPCDKTKNCIKDNYVSKYKVWYYFIFIL